VKRQNKEYFSNFVNEQCGVLLDPDSLFSSQIKRIHEYKRQLLNLIHLVSMYLRIKDNPGGNYVPRSVLFAGKSAPGYHTAKMIIKLINSAADVINSDSRTNGLLKACFVPNYSVSIAEKMIPATDLSEQISTAGTEASGTGNMKFAMNGALTIGTLDGANVEIMEEVGEQNMFIFGLRLDEVDALRHTGYNPIDYYNSNPELKRALDAIYSGIFSSDNRDYFKPLIDSLLYKGDQYLLLADFDSYSKAHDRVTETWKDRKKWTEMSIVNCANMGKFSSDRTIAEYAKDIWRADPVYQKKK
jgi:starch phosphorylase